MRITAQSGVQTRLGSSAREHPVGCIQGKQLCVHKEPSLRMFLRVGAADHISIDDYNSADRQLSAVQPDPGLFESDAHPLLVI